MVITKSLTQEMLTSSAVSPLLGASQKCTVDAYTHTSEKLNLSLMFLVFFFKEGRKARVSATG